MTDFDQVVSKVEQTANLESRPKMQVLGKTWEQWLEYLENVNTTPTLRENND